MRCAGESMGCEAEGFFFFFFIARDAEIGWCLYCVGHGWESGVREDCVFGTRNRVFDRFFMPVFAHGVSYRKASVRYACAFNFTRPTRAARV